MTSFFDYRRLALLCCGLAATLCACSSDDADTPTSPDKPQEETHTEAQTRVNIVSRAENASETGDALQAGLYMANYIEGQPDELLPANNYIDNQLLTWQNGTWQTAAPIYWFDMDTKADFYAYAPYQATIDNARQMTFTVKSDQRSGEALTQSDLLWGRVQGQSPTAGSFELTLAHRLARLTVNVTADAGFEAGELKAEDVSVTIGGTCTAGNIDLMTGRTTAIDGTTEDILCHGNGDLTYTAILIPQQVPFSNLIQVNWNGNRYQLQNSFLLEPARQYSLTVKLRKTKSGFDIGIEGWDIIPEDFGGTIGG